MCIRVHEFLNSTMKANVSIPLSPDVLPLSVLASIQKLQFDLAQWEHNPRIGKTLSDTVLSGGKRLRPLMTFLMGDLFALPHEEIAPYGRAVELVHASTLAHDDVIDNAEVRRGKPSINAVSSNKQAVLAGDYLLAYVLGDMSHRGRNDIVCELARIIGDLAEGEWLQIENAVKEDLTRADVERVAMKKTASVLRWCCVIPAMLKHANDEIIQLAKTFGEAIGVAFQLTDDILDFKRRDGAEWQDVKNGVINAVIFEAMSMDTDAQVVNMKERDGKIPSEPVLEKAIAKTRERAEFLLDSAREALRKLFESIPHTQRDSQEKAYRALNALMDYLAVRT